MLLQYPTTVISAVQQTTKHTWGGRGRLTALSEGKGVGWGASLPPGKHGGGVSSTRLDKETSDVWRERQRPFCSVPKSVLIAIICKSFTS